LLHGVTRRWQDFIPLLPALTQRWRVFALDFRGHGRSGRTPGRYHVTDYVRDVVALLKFHVREPSVLYGHSLGAMAAAGAAADAPSLVRAIVLEDPPFDTLGARIAQTPFQAFFSGLRDCLASSVRAVEPLAQSLAEIRMPRAEPPSGAAQEVVRLGDVRDAASLRFLARCLMDFDAEALAPMLAGEWLAGYERDEILASVVCPVLLLQAEWAAGGMLPDDDAKSALALLRHGLHVKVPGAGHLLHWGAQETTLRLVLSFLESV